MEAFDNKTPLLGDARQVARKNGVRLSRNLDVRSHHAKVPHYEQSSRLNPNLTQGLTGNAGSDTPVIVVNLDKNCVLQIDATSVSWTT